MYNRYLFDLSFSLHDTIIAKAENIISISCFRIIRSVSVLFDDFSQ